MSDQFQEMPVSSFDRTLDPHQNGSSSAFYSDAYARPTDDIYARSANYARPADAFCGPRVDTFGNGDQCRPSVIIINPSQRPGELAQIYDAGYGYMPTEFEEPIYRHQQFQHPAPWDEMNFPPPREATEGEMLAHELPRWIGQNTVDRLANDDFLFDVAADASGSVSYKDLVITLGLATMRLNDEPTLDNKTLFDDVLKMAPMMGVSDAGVAELQRIVGEKLGTTNGASGEVVPADQQFVDPQGVVPETSMEQQTVVPTQVPPQISTEQQTVVPTEVLPQTSAEQQTVVPQQTLEPSAYGQTDSQAAIPPGQIPVPEVGTVFGEPADPAQIASGDQTVVPGANQTVVPGSDQTVVPSASSSGTDTFAQQLDPSQVPQQLGQSQGQSDLSPVDANQNVNPTDMSQQQAQTDSQPAPSASGGTVMDQLMAKGS